MNFLPPLFSLLFYTVLTVMGTVIGNSLFCHFSYCVKTHCDSVMGGYIYPHTHPTMHIFPVGVIGSDHHTTITLYHTINLNSQNSMKKTLSPAQEKLWNDPRLNELKKRFQLEPLPSKQASYNHRIQMAVDQLFKELRAKMFVLAFAITCGYVPVHQPVGQAPSWIFWETRKPEPRGLTKENFEIPAYKQKEIAKTSWKLNPLNIIQII